MSGNTKIVKLFSSFVDGIVPVKVEIEIALNPGLPSFDIIGLCDSSISESRGRIRAAICSSGFMMPRGHITVNISPAYMRKSGSSFDLPIAIGLLLASSQLPYDKKMRIYAEGELSLDGNVRATPGSAIRLLDIKSNDYDLMIIPTEEEKSAILANLGLICCNNLKRISDMFLKDTYDIKHYGPLTGTDIDLKDDNFDYMDISALKGQEKTKRAILIAACGWHNMMLVGSPGVGKTMAGRILYSILPKLDTEEIKAVYKILNMLEVNNDNLSFKRPFRYIHQSINKGQLIYNSVLSSPGEVILANKGVLFVDECCEFKRADLELLREPMENRKITIIKDGVSYDFDSDFLMVAATNPCKCGMFLEDGIRCTCTPSIRKRYQNKLSGPFLDRIDLFTEMKNINAQGLKEMIELSQNNNENLYYKEQVVRVWEMSQERYKNFNGKYNATVICENISEIMRVSKEEAKLAVEIASVNGFSPRSFNRLIRVGRTIADIEGQKDVLKKHIMEAQVYKNRSFIR